MSSTSAFGHLYWSQAVDFERSATLFLRDNAVIRERDFGIKAVSQHALIISDQLVVDPYILQREAGQLCNIAIVPRIEPSTQDIDDLD